MTPASPLIDLIRWTADGLVAAIVQDAETGQVLMMAWMDRPAVIRTMETGQTHFYSRSRRSSWHKGGTSGHVQHVREIRVDCDADVLLVLADQVGGACHEGFRSCFFRRVREDGSLLTIGEKVFQPDEVYRGGIAAGA